MSPLARAVRLAPRGATAGGLALALAVAAAALASNDTDAPAGPFAEPDDAKAPPAPILLPSGAYVPPPLPPGPPPLGVIPEALLDAARAARDLPLPERMKAVSDPLLGTPYVTDPLGEGVAPDDDPLARYDAFDCLTFVEETLALALAGDPLHAAEVRLSLRYGDKPPEYANRRHFMELEWLPGNVHDGWIRDITKTLGPTVHQELDVTTDTWRHWGGRRRLALTDDELPTGKMALDVLPIDAAIAAMDRIPPGSIVLTVRQNQGVPIWTTHLGFVVQGKDHLLLRNASRRSAMRVLDENLAWYLQHMESDLYSRRPVLGIAVFQPIDQDPRVSDLPPAVDAEPTADAGSPTAAAP